jgi:hypothetical protein
MPVQTPQWSDVTFNHETNKYYIRYCTLGSRSSYGTVPDACMQSPMLRLRKCTEGIRVVLALLGT